MASAPTITPSALTGDEQLPRNPSPSKGPPTLSPGVFAGTSQIVLAPSTASGLLDQMYESASPAEVDQLFFASRRTSPFTLVAELIGAQNWLRDPLSEKASVVTCSPRATASRASRGPKASITAAPQ
jgi:hypothetical protein